MNSIRTFVNYFLSNNILLFLLCYALIMVPIVGIGIIHNKKE